MKPTVRQVVAAIRKPTTFTSLLGYKRFIDCPAATLHLVLLDAEREGYLIEVCEMDGEWYFERTKAGSDLLKKG